MPDSEADFVENVSRIFHSGIFPDPYWQIVAKCSVLFHYGIPVTEENIRDIRDLDGNRILVKDWERGGGVPLERYRQRVLASELDHNIFVFVHVWGSMFRCMGWTSREQVEEHEINWQTDRWGDRVDYSYYLSLGDLAPMPEHFLFMDTCQHFDRWGGIWNDSARAFQCFGCNRFIHSEADRRLVADTSEGDYLSASETGT